LDRCPDINTRKGKNAGEATKVNGVVVRL